MLCGLSGMVAVLNDWCCEAYVVGVGYTINFVTIFRPVWMMLVYSVHLIVVVESVFIDIYSVNSVIYCTGSCVSHTVPINMLCA
jgi:hypothetical protein